MGNEPASRGSVGTVTSGLGQEAYLALEDGQLFRGQGFGAAGIGRGELVFATGMTGYQESCTDPSYAGQVLMFTFPLIGNYGVAPAAAESERVWPQAVIVRSWCRKPNHRSSVGTFHDFLMAQDRPGITGLDTRALTVSIRERGTLRCVVGVGNALDPDQLLEQATTMAWPSDSNLVARVSCQEPMFYPKGGGPMETRSGILGTTDTGLAPQRWDPSTGLPDAGKMDTGPLVVLIDTGVKANILREWQKRANLLRLPWNGDHEQVMAIEPDLLFVSNGPGDPDHPELRPMGELLRRVSGEGLPIAGICLGHQLLGLAFGATTAKLKFGHRGGNQPVKELDTGRCYITSQNHGYAVAQLPEELVATRINLNDNTNEGLAHTELTVESVQFHPEAHPGPWDTKHLFDEFLKMTGRRKGQRAPHG